MMERSQTLSAEVGDVEGLACCIAVSALQSTDICSEDALTCILTEIPQDPLFAHAVASFWPGVAHISLRDWLCSAGHVYRGNRCRTGLASAV